MVKIKVLALSGSLRKDSYNRKVLQLAKSYALEEGAEVDEADLKELNLPLYDEDIENQGMPDSVLKLKEMVIKADVLLIASPEYNYSISGVLKNALDWLSRGNNSLEGKVAAVFGVSTGRFGTAIGQLHLREVLEKLGVYLLPEPRVFIWQAEGAFNPDGSLKNKETQAKLKVLIQKTFKFSKEINQ